MPSIPENLIDTNAKTLQLVSVKFIYCWESFINSKLSVY